MNNTNTEIQISSTGETPTFQEGWPCFLEHSLMEAAIVEAARELQVSRGMAMMCAFGAMATACQGQVDVQLPTGHQVPTSLMLLTIADSGERKTTTQNYFFDAINTLNSKAYEDNKAALIEHRVEHQLWGTHKRHLERMYNKFATQEDKDATHAALKAIEEHARAEPRPPISGKFLYEDTTPQALVQMLYENTPNGCLLTSEANSIFSGKALGELDKLNTIWDGSNVIVDRISREGFILQDARLTLSLMAQPSVIATFMGKRGEEARGTGFLARFLVIKPLSMAGQRIQRPMSPLLRQKAFSARIQECLSSSNLSDRQVLFFSEPAKNLWYEYSQKLEQEMQENGLYYYLKDHASKLLENTSRLAAILHTFERTSNSDIEISLFTLKFCWELVRLCSNHFMEHLANEPQLVTDTNDLAHYLLKIANQESHNSAPSTLQHSHAYKTQVMEGRIPPDNLLSGVEARFTLTQVKRFGPNSLRGRANAARLEAAINLLTKLGHIIKEGSYFRFKETILNKREEPTLKNGTFITIKELPLFNEQEYWEPDVYDKFGNQEGYFFKSK